MNREEVKQAVAQLITEVYRDELGHQEHFYSNIYNLAGTILDFLDSIGYDATVELALQEARKKGSN